MVEAKYFAINSIYCFFRGPCSFSLQNKVILLQQIRSFEEFLEQIGGAFLEGSTKMLDDEEEETKTRGRKQNND